MIRGVIFDLDDTLYFEERYVRSGFRAVARRLARESRVKARAAYELMWAMHASGERGRIFDQALERLELPPSLAGELVAEYRSHQPRLKLAPSTRDLLGRLAASGVRLGIITDGFSFAQHAKIDCLGLRDLCEEVICTADVGEGCAKPSPVAFELMAHRLGLPPHALAYVADNPLKDFLAPRALGWLTVRYRDVRQLRHALEAPIPDAKPHLELRRLAGLARRLERPGA